MTHMPMHELHGQDPPSDLSDKASRAHVLELSLFFIFILFRMARRLSRREKGENSSGSREPKDALFHFV